jgi:hypothetical protein
MCGLFYELQAEHIPDNMAPRTTLPITYYLPTILIQNYGILQIASMSFLSSW